MNLKDILGSISGSGSADSGDIMKLATDLLSQDGSSSTIDSLLGALKSGGLQEKVQSWIGSGDNQEINEEEISASLDKNTLKNLAESTGISKDKVPALLAQVLPSLVDKLTPQGKEPSSGLMDLGMGLLKKML